MRCGKFELLIHLILLIHFIVGMLISNLQKHHHILNYLVTNYEVVLLYFTSIIA